MALIEDRQIFKLRGISESYWLIYSDVNVLGFPFWLYEWSVSTRIGSKKGSHTPKFTLKKEIEI